MRVAFALRDMQDLVHLYSIYGRIRGEHEKDLASISSLF